MKVICDGLDLSDAVLKVIKATATKTTNPILEGIKILSENDIITLSATDLELGIEKKIKADVKIEGETVVPGRFFSEYIKKLTGEQIELTLNENNQLKIKYTESEGAIQCFNALEFPKMRAIEDANYFTINSRDFKTLISKTSYAVATDDLHPVLKGILLEVVDNTIKAVALDGHRVALVQKNLKNTTANLSVTVPARSLNEIGKMLPEIDQDIKVYIQKNYLMVQINETKISSRLLDADFINYKQIIPHDFTTSVVINKAQLEDAIDRASLLSRIDRNNLVKFEFGEKILKLTSNSEIGNIKENLNISLKGNDLTISFNARYFSEALRVINDEFIRLNFTSSIAPCIIKPNEGEEFLFVILPVRNL